MKKDITVLGAICLIISLILCAPCVLLYSYCNRLEERIDALEAVVYPDQETSNVVDVEKVTTEILSGVLEELRRKGTKK